MWLRPFGKLLYTMPPYVIGEKDLGAVGAAMRHVVEAVQSESRAADADAVI